jgi:AraC-like DNA-binding protein
MISTFVGAPPTLNAGRIFPDRGHLAYAELAKKRVVSLGGELAALVPKLHRQVHKTVVSLQTGNETTVFGSGDTDPAGSAQCRETEGMSGSGISAFDEPDDFAASMAETGATELVVVRPGAFAARMTRIILTHLRLSSVEEQLARLAFVAPPRGTVRIFLPIRGSLSPVYGGMRVEPRVIVIHGGGNGAYERLDGSCHWGDILVPQPYLARYGRAVAGAPLKLAAGAHRWRPPRRALGDLARLHAAAIRVTQARHGAAPGAEAVRGLEQELTQALIECLSGSAADPGSAAERRHGELMAAFAAAVRIRGEERLSASELARSLGISERTLRACCKAHLNMGPSRYLRARRMQLARRALRNADPSATTVARVARRYGFVELGRFAASYRALFGELPSATLKT